MIYENDIYFLQQLYDRWAVELSPTNDKFQYEDHNWYLNEDEMIYRGNGNATVEIKDVLDVLYFAIEGDTDHALSIQDYAYNSGVETVSRDSRVRFEFLADLFLSKFSNKIKWNGQGWQQRRADEITDFVDAFMLLEDKTKGESLKTQKFMITDRYDNKLYIYYPTSEFTDLDD